MFKGINEDFYKICKADKLYVFWTKNYEETEAIYNLKYLKALQEANRNGDLIDFAAFDFHARDALDALCWYLCCVDKKDFFFCPNNPFYDDVVLGDYLYSHKEDYSSEKFEALTPFFTCVQLSYMPKHSSTYHDKKKNFVCRYSLDNCIESIKVSEILDILFDCKLDDEILLLMELH